MAKRRIQGTRATPVEWPTHPAVKKWTPQVVNRTKNGPAVFMPGLLTPAQFAELYEEEDINTIPVGADPDAPGVNRYWRDMGYPVGASNGKVTQYILVKRDSDIVHARPVTKEELKQVWRVKGL